jgi:hypothetical protein
MILNVFLNCIYVNLSMQLNFIPLVLFQFKAILLEMQIPVTEKKILILEDAFLFPAVGILIILAAVSGIAVTAQKHKRH